jgi:hypothetical protein
MKSIIMNIILVMSLLLTMNSCGIPSSIDNATTAIEASRKTIEQQSDAWREELNNLIGQLETIEGNSAGDVKSIISATTNQISTLLKQSKDIADTLSKDAIARAGVEAKCSVSFTQKAISNQLQYIIDDLKFWDKNKAHLDSKPPHVVCHTNPETIRLYQAGDSYQINSSNMAELKQIKVFGYNFRSDAMPWLDFYDKSNNIIQEKIAVANYITQYLIILDFSIVVWNKFRDGAYLEFHWPDVVEKNRILFSLIEPAKLILHDLVISPPNPIMGKDDVHFKITITNVGGMASEPTTVVILHTGIANKPNSSFTLSEPIQPGVDVEIPFPDKYIFPLDQNYKIWIDYATFFL